MNDSRSPDRSIALPCDQCSPSTGIHARRIGRCFFICTALLLLLAKGAHAGGTYQHTKDGKTLVWNNYPTPGEEATWSGDRDKDGYAIGNGTLKWYTPTQVKRTSETASHVTSDKKTVVSHYSGKMVRGKLEGPVVNVDGNGKTFHATFAKGKLRGDWTAEPGPSSLEVQRKEPAAPKTSDGAPAEGPPQSAAATSPASTVSQRPVAEAPSRVSDSLRSLTAPPSSLRTNDVTDPSAQASIPSTASSSTARPSLTMAEVIGLADAEARTQGYKLGEYQHPQARYIAADDTWSVVYEQKSVEGVGETGKHFSVSVEDKTKKTSSAGR